MQLNLYKMRKIISQMRRVSPEPGPCWPGRCPGPAVGAPVGAVPDRVLLHHPGRGQDPGVLRGQQEERGAPGPGMYIVYTSTWQPGDHVIIWIFLGSQDIRETEEGLPGTNGDGRSPEPVDHKAGILQPGPRHLHQQQVWHSRVFSLFVYLCNS